MFFKRKPKRSEWMKGLLACEGILKDGFDYERQPTRLIFRKENTTIWQDSWINNQSSNKDKYKGLCDYLDYYSTTLAQLK